MPGTALHLFIPRCANRLNKEEEKKKKTKTKNPSADRKSRCQTNRDEKLAYNGKPTELKGPCETEMLPLSKKSDDAAAGLDKCSGIVSVLIRIEK